MAIVGASLAGGVIPSVLKLTHRRLQMALSFVAGAMLGVALFHMLPHAVLDVLATRQARGESFGHSHFDRLTAAMVGGFLVMFLLERFAQFHRHEPDQPHECDDGHDHAQERGFGGAGAGTRGRERGRAHELAGARAQVRAPAVSGTRWVGALVGLSVHALLEGVALAASVLAGAGASHGHDHGEIAGIGVFLVILLHKPFDSMTLLTLFHAADSAAARRKALVLNFVFALIVPIGAAMFCLGAAPFLESSAIVPLALAFSAGTFLCIASSDLLPELQFHRHDRVALSVSLVLGLLLAWGIGFMETEMHDHHSHGTATSTKDGEGGGAGTGAGSREHGHDHDHDHAH